ncbi:hypothetical protein C7120_08555 [Prevotella sp. oral taxon 376]|uniref:DUF3127 domain-containing protein n=1 Tax=Prevotella sp. oral taxon 376 TaxID=712466 RepID=UPI000D1EA60F|nr:DUF3127 domain-containing protein [Prevotella sp. oral taxon 376]PTL34544.1 hypothetical protein C7120_08555 [Prevotella sp. oral taxon 376]
MDLQGKIIAAMPERSGVSARSGQEWKVQSFVLETHDAYPKKMVFDVFGSDRLTRFNIQVGQEVMVSFDIDAHEYQGRWFNSIRAYDVRLVDPASIGVAGVQPATQTSVISDTPPAADPFPPQQSATEGSADDLPF